jgi:hypothetical protein
VGGDGAESAAATKNEQWVAMFRVRKKGARVRKNVFNHALEIARNAKRTLKSL